MSITKVTARLAVAAVFVASAAVAADITWNGGSGNLAADESWAGGAAPGPGDRSLVGGSGEWNLTTTGDFSAGHAGFWCENGPLSVDIDLGGFSWTGACANDWVHRFVVNGSDAHPMTMTLRGVFGNFTGFHVGGGFSGYGGVGYSNARVEVTGVGTSFACARDDTTIGTDGTNNVLVVSGGASFTSGRAIVLGSAQGSNNMLRVTGADTVFALNGAGDYNRVGRLSSGNRLVVEKGAKLSQATGSHLAVGDGAGAAFNTMTVSENAAVTLEAGTTAVIVGNGTSALGNAILVSNSVFSVVEASVGNGEGATGNVVRVSGGTFSVKQNTYLGRVSGANGNTFVLDGAGTVYSNLLYDAFVGHSGSGNAMEIAGGASAWVNRNLYVGNAATASGNELTVRGAGSILYAGSKETYVGNSGASLNRISVLDGGVFTNGQTAVYVGAANSRSNAVDVSGAGSFFSSFNHVHIGSGTNASFNRVTVRGGAEALFACGTDIGCANGSCSNVLEVLDGAVLDVCDHDTEQSGWNNRLCTGPYSATLADFDDASIVGNGIVVSNASLVTHGTVNSPEFHINYRGTGGYLKALDGAFVCPNQSFTLGNGGVNSRNGLIYAAGEGTVLTNKRYHLYVGRNGGSGNTVWIDDGAKMYVQTEMQFGNDGYESATNNCLKITNGTFWNTTGGSLNILNAGRLVWGGSRSAIHVNTLTMTGGGTMEFVFDEDGIAPMKPIYETYLLDGDFVPTVDRIVIDATAYVKGPSAQRRTFTIMGSVNNRFCRRITEPSTNWDATEERKSAVNKAFLDRIVCVPEGYVTVTKVDMTKSLIEVSTRPMRGFTLIFR